ncbi:hypothetical protein Sp245p_21025 (plasmid) [Azospirillum baldaniorum]|nr:hypothetical protein Sp245p_21025 [Azospirillum baldaniorum]
MPPLSHPSGHRIDCHNPLPSGERVARRAGEGDVHGGRSGTSKPPHPNPLPGGERGYTMRMPCPIPSPAMRGGRDFLREPR